MTGRARTAIVLMISLGLAGCRGSASSAPTSPTAAMAPATVPASSGTAVTLTDAGHVLDTAFKPVAGVRVDVMDGPQAGTSMMTDSAGEFPLRGTFARTDSFRATANGYTTVIQGFSTSVPGGKPWLIFYLPPLTPPVNLAGDYSLTVAADSACTDLPADLRTRTYATTIAQGANPNAFVLTASGGPFLNHLAGFGIGVAGDSLGLWLHGGHDPSIVEQLGPTTYFAFSGMASTLAGSPETPISAALDGWIDYCVMRTPMGSTYNCGTSNVTGDPIPGIAVEYRHCQSANHRLILTRR